MLTQNEFELWRERLKFSPETRVLLAGLPRLREISVGWSPNVAREGMAIFPDAVRVNYW